MLGAVKEQLATHTVWAQMFRMVAAAVAAMTVHEFLSFL